MPKKPHVRTLMDSQDVKVSERLLKYARQYFRHIFWSLWEKITSKNYILVVTEILRHFANILTPNGKYSLSKSECLTNPIQMQLPQNQKVFSEFVAAFPASTWNLEYFEQQNEPQRFFSLKL